MKKMLCTLLSIFLLISISAIGTSAVEEGPFEISMGTSNGYEIYFYGYYPSVEMPLEYRETLGNYIFNSHVTKENGMPIKAVKDGEELTIPQAFEIGVINIKEVAAMVNAFDFTKYHYYLDARLLGDLNKNRTIDIDDVITLQKHLALVTDIPNLDVYFSDCNQDGYANTKDVLMMQKIIAGIIDFS